MRVGIIGGGISGLSAAFYLEKERTKGVPLTYVLLEAGNRLGGSMFSEHIDGCLVEGGPDSFLTEKPWAANLCQELGIADQLIGSNDAERKTYIVVHNRLIAMPDGLMFMVPTKILPTALSPLFSMGTKCRMLAELLHPPRPMRNDETVAQMVERHFGPEVVDRLADPLLSGVYGGDASDLSARAVLPRFVDMEEKYGSLSRAMLAAHNKMKAAMAHAKPRPLFSSLRDGMQQMIDALLERVDRSALRTGTSVQSIALRDGKYDVTTSAGVESFDALVMATPARVAGQLLANVDGKLADDLRAVQYSSSVTVTMGYGMQQLAGLPPGFGFLVPRSEHRRMLACTFVHNKFPHRAPADKGIVRSFLGGSKDETVLSLSDQEIESIVRAELKAILGLDAEPRFIRIYRWRGAMAQYTTGHLDRVARIEAAVKSRPSLEIAGNAFRGIGVPDCIRTGQEAALRLSLLAANAAQPAR